MRSQNAELESFSITRFLLLPSNFLLLRYFLTRRWCVLGMRMSSRYLATVRRVTWIPCDCRMRVICSSVNGRLGSSSSMSFLTRRLRIKQRCAAALGTLHALAEEVPQLEYALRSVGILAGHSTAYRRRMHADFFGHLLDHHGLEVIDTALEEILLAGDDANSRLW